MSIAKNFAAGNGTPHDKTPPALFFVILLRQTSSALLSPLLKGGAFHFTCPHVLDTLMVTQT